MYRLFLIFLIFPALMLYVRCEKNSGPTGSEDETDNTDTMVVRKPNIYLYPENGQELTIRLIFPSGGNVIESVPEYGTGWDIYVDPSGLIDNQFMKPRRQIITRVQRAGLLPEIPCRLFSK